MNNKISETIGWIGTTLVVSAYFLNTYNYILVTDIIYPIMNVTASACILVSVWSKKAYAVSGLQIVWGVIALGSLLGMIF